MPSLLSSFADTWRDAVRDVVLIVVSIVIAFAVDAWWESLGERGIERAHLEALLTEFREVAADITGELEVVGRSERATRDLLDLVASRGVHVSADSVSRLMNISFNVGGPSFAGGALAALLGSGELPVLRNRSLAAKLAGWPRLNAQILSNSSILVQNRELEITDYLVEAGVPLSKLAGNLEGLGLPASPFEFDPAPLLSDPGFESMFVSRAVRLRLLGDAYGEALAEADTITRLIENALTR